MEYLLDLKGGRWIYRPGRGHTYICSAPKRIDAAVLMSSVRIDGYTYVIVSIEYPGQTYHADVGEQVALTVLGCPV